MTRRAARIAYDRFIKVPWLEQAAAYAEQGLGISEISQGLENFLEGQIQGKNSRRKTRTVLTGVWVNLPEEMTGFRNQGLKLLKTLKEPERLAVHWGMSAAAYPFFAFAARQIGRLHKLQNEITSAQVKRRIAEHYGDIESVHRAAARLMQSLCSWEVLVPKTKGSYTAASPIPLRNPLLLPWIAEATFYARSSPGLSLRQISTDPLWFPFSFSVDSKDIAQYPSLTLFRQGLDEDFVMK